jgi:uncharacterized protein (TIGR02266 family)
VERSAGTTYGPGYSGGHMPFVARQRRIDMRAAVIFGIGGEQLTAETRNIGLGGVFVATDTPAPVGRWVSLHIALPNWDEFHFVNAEVRWGGSPNDGPPPSGSCGMGVRFVKLSLHVAAVLDRFIRSHTVDR